MPEGSVRALIALVVIFGAVIGGLIFMYFKMIDVPEKLWELALIVAAFYFGMRSNNGKVERIPKEEIEKIVAETVKEECIE